MNSICYQILLTDPTLEPWLTDTFFKYGAISVCIEDATNTLTEFCESKNSIEFWTSCWIKGVFLKESFLLSDLRREINFQLKEPIIEKWQEIPEINWVEHWQQQTQPIFISNKLVISPSHCLIQDPNIIQIQIDPGMAYGTGQQPATQLCLKWLAKFQCQDKTFIDYGCGSGILAITAAKLGAKKIWAVDIDPLAIKVTQENCNKNKIPSDILKAIYPKSCSKKEVDVVIANIYLNELINLQPTLTPLIRKGGHLLLSGILFSQKDKILTSYSPYFDFLPAIKHNEWILLVGEKY